MNTKFQVVVSLTLFLLLVSAGAAAEARPGMRHPPKNKTYRFDTLDYPGAASSIVFDINTTDKTAVGIFRTVVTVAYGTGFALKGGKYTLLQVPGALGTALVGINRSDQMVGYYLDSEGVPHGVLDSGGKITVLDYPGADQTLAYGINDSGLVVGSYQGTYGFLYDHGNYSSINYPGSLETTAFGINSAGEIVGFWWGP